MLLNLIKVLQTEFKKEKGFCISSIISDHENEFENEFFKTFHDENVMFPYVS